MSEDKGNSTHTYYLYNRIVNEKYIVVKVKPKTITTITYEETNEDSWDIYEILNSLQKMVHLKQKASYFTY